MKKIILFSTLIASATVYAQSPANLAESKAQKENKPATIKEYQKVFTTYPFGDPNPIPLLTAVYPYYRFDGFTSTPVEKEWKVVELENDYIRLLILPEIGGKIWTAIEKSTNRPFLYYNHAVKFRDIAMRGPWTSGGLESNFGIIGHTPNCATPVDYSIRTNEDGSVSCIIGALDLLTRSNWRMEINLPKDKAYFTTRASWFNQTPLSQPYYHWMNAGLKAAGNLEFIYPGNKYIGHEGEYADWPINPKNGRNISFYEQNNFGGPKSYHVFGAYTNFAGAYWHDDGMGMVRYASHDDKAGKKIWIWGLSGQGMIWEKLLTDHDGQYVEVQSGRLFNQNAEKSSLTPFKHKSLQPYESDTWTEYWYPVLETHSMVEANEYGALNLKYANGSLHLYFSPVQAIRDTLVVRQGGKIIYSRLLSLSPLQTFSDSLPLSSEDLSRQAARSSQPLLSPEAPMGQALPPSLTITLGQAMLTWSSDPHTNDLSRPVDAPGEFDWNSAYGLYVSGKEAMDQKNYPLGEERLKASLEKDPCFLPALTKYGELLYRNMRYSGSLKILKKALQISTEDGAANYYYGLVNARLGNPADAKDGFDIASLDPAFRSAAYTELAKLYLREKDYPKAVTYSKKAIDFNRYGIEALQLEALACRYLHNEQEAFRVMKEINSLDPLNHFSRFEKYCWMPGEETKKAFTSLIRNELPAETYLELAIWYYEAGCRKEAETLFRFCPPSTEASYWLAFLQNRLLDSTELAPAFSFPFRSETGTVLEHLLQRQDYWLLKYHLALIYHDRNRLEESRQLLLSCHGQPDFAPFYAVRSVICKDETSSVTDLQKALSLDDQWRYRKLLTGWYLDHQLYADALATIEPYYKHHPEQYIIGMLYAKTLLLNQRYKETDKVLHDLTIIPFEGATEGHELYREAKLMQALRQMQVKKYSLALSLIREAGEWPENLGVGKPYEEDIDQRLEQWMTRLCISHTRQGNNKNQTDTILSGIIAFEPAVHNTIANFFASNALVTAWSLEKTRGHEKALQWLNGQLALYPQNPLLQWSRARFEKQDFQLSPAQKDPNARILDQLIRMDFGN